MRQSTLLAVALATSAKPILAQTVEFFYTETLDTCEMSGIFLPANEQTTHGGVCAWRPDVERVYGCPAPDTTCWTSAQSCTDSAIGQTICNKAGAVWCCNAVAGETCTTAEGYINVCQSGFANPESGVSVDHANQVYLAAIGLSNVTATSQTVDPTPFSTLNLGTPSTSSSASSSSSTTTESGSKSMSSTTTISSPSAATTTAPGSVATGFSESNTDSTTTTNTSGSGVSMGAIIGIVIGALVILGLVGAAFFILGRRRSKSENTYDPIEGSVATPNVPGYREKDAKVPTSELYGSQNGSSELGDNAVSRVEMPAGHANVVGSNTQLRHELA